MAAAGVAAKALWSEVALRSLVCQLQLEPQVEAEQVFRLLDAVGGADGGVEGGMGIAEAVSAGGLAGAIEFAQGAVVALRDRTGRSRAGPSRARSSPD